jgi:hypothetical protein
MQEGYKKMLGTKRKRDLLWCTTLLYIIMQILICTEGYQLKLKFLSLTALISSTFKLHLLILISD